MIKSTNLFGDIQYLLAIVSSRPFKSHPVIFISIKQNTDSFKGAIMGTTLVLPANIDASFLMTAVVRSILV